jgi:predicted transglutaminase-like cysteine proteinase
LSGEANGHLYAPEASVVIAPTYDQAQDQATDQAQKQTQDQAQDQSQDQATGQPRDDSQAQVTVAALDPAEPSIASPAPAAPAVPSPAAAEPFGLTAFPVGSGDLIAKWSGVEADIRAENDILARCRDSANTCPPAARNFLAIVAQGRAHTGRARIGVINRAINLAIRPMSDLVQWGVPDRWSAPLQTLTTGLGDCEDYAIAKYVALREAGIAAQDVKLVIVRNTGANEDHAVTAVRLDGGWVVLDNRWLRMVEDDEMSGADPLFVLDGSGVRIFAPALSARRAAASTGPAGAPGSLGF